MLNLKKKNCHILQAGMPHEDVIALADRIFNTDIDDDE